MTRELTPLWFNLCMEASTQVSRLERSQVCDASIALKRQLGIFPAYCLWYMGQTGVKSGTALLYNDVCPGASHLNFYYSAAARQYPWGLQTRLKAQSLNFCGKFRPMLVLTVLSNFSPKLSTFLLFLKCLAHNSIFYFKIASVRVILLSHSQ